MCHIFKKRHCQTRVCPREGDQGVKRLKPTSCTSLLWNLEACSLWRVSHLHAMAWALCHVSLGSYLKKFFCPHGKPNLEFLFGRQTSVSGKTCFRLNWKMDLICFVMRKICLWAILSFFLPHTTNLGYIFLTTKFRFLGHHFPVFQRVCQMSGSWNIVF